eukprot:g456.t1
MDQKLKLRVVQQLPTLFEGSRREGKYFVSQAFGRHHKFPFVVQLQRDDDQRVASESTHEERDGESEIGERKKDEIEAPGGRVWDTKPERVWMHVHCLLEAKDGADRPAGCSEEAFRHGADDSFIVVKDPRRKIRAFQLLNDNDTRHHIRNEYQHRETETGIKVEMRNGQSILLIRFNTVARAHNMRRMLLRFTVPKFNLTAYSGPVFVMSKVSREWSKAQSKMYMNLVTDCKQVEMMEIDRRSDTRRAKSLAKRKAQRVVMASYADEAAMESKVMRPKGPIRGSRGTGAHGPLHPADRRYHAALLGGNRPPLLHPFEAEVVSVDKDSGKRVYCGLHDSDSSLARSVARAAIEGNTLYILDAARAAFGGTFHLPEWDAVYEMQMPDGQQICIIASALHFAAGEGHVRTCADVLRLIPSTRVDVQTWQGDTPLMWAAWMARLDVVRLLLRHGSNPNHINREGCTPLMCAAESGSRECVTELLVHGADPSVRDAKGDSAFHCAKTNVKDLLCAALGVPFEDAKHTSQKVEQVLAQSKVHNFARTRAEVHMPDGTGRSEAQRTTGSARGRRAGTKKRKATVLLVCKICGRSDFKNGRALGGHSKYCARQNREKKGKKEK